MWVGDCSFFVKKKKIIRNENYPHYCDLFSVYDQMCVKHDKNNYEWWLNETQIM